MLYTQEAMAFKKIDIHYMEEGKQQDHEYMLINDTHFIVM